MNSTLLLRRCFCCASTAPSSSSLSIKKKPLVFLGSPQVSAKVLDALFNASQSSDSFFEVGYFKFTIAAIVTQPPARQNRGRKVMPSAVAQYALDRGFYNDLIFTPERASEEWFLANLRSLEPELCITAAYGNILSTKFLNIPKQGWYVNLVQRVSTVNIHPSLLPLYRGAAPVQRALQDGVKETGVSLAFTVRALDAGPVLASQRTDVDIDIKAPDLLDFLFDLGVSAVNFFLASKSRSKLLLHELPSILDGTARINAQPQDDSKATLAPKITPEESWLSFDQEAIILHNKVRAFAGWPGTRARVQIVDAANAEENILDLKIITTKVPSSSRALNAEPDYVAFKNGALIFTCGGGTTLEVLEVQLPGKKAVNAAAFWNGLRGQKLKIVADKGAAISQV
ncbi:Methionyl-tRNA formyltransferase [Bienertia sinuspersici]